jgi:hypothetical protein
LKNAARSSGRSLARMPTAFNELITPSATFANAAST